MILINFFKFYVCVNYSVSKLLFICLNFPARPRSTVVFRFYLFFLNHPRPKKASKWNSLYIIERACPCLSVHFGCGEPFSLHKLCDFVFALFGLVCVIFSHFSIIFFVHICVTNPNRVNETLLNQIFIRIMKQFCRSSKLS